MLSALFNVSADERKMWTSIKCQLVVTAILANYVNAQVGVDDVCHHSTKGIPGVCKRLDQCLTAMQELKQGIYPQICGYVGTASVVCCTEAETAPPPPPLTIKTPTDESLVGEKSIQACQSYEMLAYTKQESPVLAEYDYDLIGTCPWDNEAYSLLLRNNHSMEAEFPHMALIGYRSYPHEYEWKCVGSLLSDKFVLTAAQCADAAVIGEPQFVRLGDLDYVSSNDDKYVQQINVKDRIKHPLYKSPALYHDIALLELERPATLNLYVKPICLYTQNPTGRQLSIVTGWSLSEEGKSSNVLFYWYVRHFSTETCSLTYEDETSTLPRGVDAEVQVCYGSYDNQKDTCQSDLGGPIQTYSKDVYCSYYIFGITSFGKGCSRTNVPVGYVKLSPYVEWIESIVWP